METLRAAPKVNSLPQEKVLEMARAIVHLVESKKEASVALVAAKERKMEVAAVAKMRAKKGGGFVCGQDHFVRGCPEVKNGIGQRTGKLHATGGQRGGQRGCQPPAGTGGRSGGLEGQWVFHPFSPSGRAFPAFEGNEFGPPSEQPLAQYQ